MKGRAALLLAMLALAGCRREAPPPRAMSRAEVADVLGRLGIAPGLWEMRTAIVDAAGPNLPVEARRRMIGPRPTIRHCITPEQASRPADHFLSGGGRPGCTYRGFALAGPRLTGTTICPGVTTRMSGTYRPRGFDARIEIDQRMPDGAILTLSVASLGRRIGACPEQSPLRPAGAVREVPSA